MRRVTVELRLEPLHERVGYLAPQGEVVFTGHSCAVCRIISMICPDGDLVLKMVATEGVATNSPRRRGGAKVGTSPDVRSGRTAYR